MPREQSSWAKPLPMPSEAPVIRAQIWSRLLEDLMYLLNVFPRYRYMRQKLAKPNACRKAQRPPTAAKMLSTGFAFHSALW